MLLLAFQCNCSSLKFENIYQSPSEQSAYFKSLKMRNFLGSGYDLPVLNLLDSQYILNVAIDSTGQVFRMVPDILTPKSWLPSSTCWSLACFLHSRYKTQKPLSGHSKSFSQLYGSGKVSGFHSTDSFRVQSLNFSSTFGEITNFEGASWLTARFDGVLSLQSVLSSLIETNNQMSQVIELSSNNGSVSSALGRCSEGFTFMNADKSNEFRVEGKGLWVGQKKVKRDFKVVFDLQTPLILFDRTMYALISDKVKVDAMCRNLDSLPIVKIQLQGVTLVLEPKDYVLRNDNQCLLAFASWDFPEGWQETIVIGSRLLEKHQVCFDFKTNRLGFKSEHLE